MGDKYIVATGYWIDAIGTIISLIAEVRELSKKDTLNDLILTVGEGLQATGEGIAAAASDEDAFNIAGAWIDSIGAAGASFGSYMQYIQEDDEEGLILEILGDIFQSLGSFMDAISDYNNEQYKEAIGDALQGIGATLEALASAQELKKASDNHQLIDVIGAFFQAVGANVVAVESTRRLKKMIDYMLFINSSLSEKCILLGFLNYIKNCSRIF